MAHFLVTGGCGFIGSHLVEELMEGGHRVRVLDNLSTGKLENLSVSVEVIRGDVTKHRDVIESIDNVDGIFHLAAIASVKRTTTEWLECHATNLTGAINVFDAASRARGGAIPVVYASSAAVYGDSPAVTLTETEIPRPISAYGADKLGCELHAHVATLLHRVPTVGLRLFNIYGPRQDPTSPYAGVISIFADRIPRKLSIDVFGDGLQVRDFVFVRDAVKFFLAGMPPHRGVGNAYNVCTGRGTNIVELANIISDLCGARPEIRFQSPRAGDIRRSIGDPISASQALGCIADTSIRDGLAETLRALVN